MSQGKQHHKKRRRREAPVDHSKYTWGKADEEPTPSRTKGNDEVEEKKKKPKMRLEKSGLLRQEALKNKESGAVVHYVACDDSAMPTKKWRLYPFKGEQSLDAIPLHRREWYLFGKEREVVHIPTDNLSCSRQHAVLQFRRLVKVNEYGDETSEVKPYIMDLKSTNGTFLNESKLDSLKYYELQPKDMLKFANSSREYVLLYEEMGL